MTEEKIWYTVFGLAVNIAMFVIPLVMLLDSRKRKGKRKGKK